MKRAIVCVLLAGGVLLMAGCGGGGSAPASGDVAKGQALFGQACHTCHGPEGGGIPSLGKDLHNNEFTASKSDADLVQFIKEGRPATHPDNTRGIDMPVGGGKVPAYSDEELGYIVAYLRTLE